MPVVTIDCRRIVDWPTFHAVFAEAFGFPDFYGKNMDAWIDCMSHLDDPGAGMTSVHCAGGGVVTLSLANARALPAEQYAAVVECAAFVNWRRLERGDSPVLALAYHLSGS